ncbi:hypothetical protein LTR99_000415 [Exophiala xenobiotica]|uniref:Zn(2)-C6 fungal-type domain-containing protein n=1 Tax=Vermiconidia calcicola TaxID=1690605 RepID=A0AAV9QIN7_9PEZI|nr:hypothetical protein LTR92_003164 [Exophiala xenobiotica]KAK5543756.1 hypothetical protein LTR25_001371 [Vermiconidia calcicola]KAK5548434.1 hypothetical protein LTR23_001564 [Chaetothyriales sp. CCFEE 6169]KAK5231270.1 hypothetical protein LTR72_000451 [Exophiala xenobiotica]KAK5237793.1 hypothetical protein LTR47_000885 [Exophiala xenobiotica]
MGQKRRRLALSCVACRRRKVKCDRTYPTCVRCQKGGVSCDYVSYTAKDGFPTPSDESPHQQRESSAASWTEEANVWYHRSKERDNNVRTQEDLTPVPTSSTQRGPPQTKSIQDLHERILELETHLAARPSHPLSTERFKGRPSLPSLSSDKTGLQDFDRSLLRGQGFKTQYMGPSHGASLLLQFEELSGFVKDILHRLPTLQRARSDWKQKRRQIKPSIVLPDHETLLSLIPDQANTDKLVQLYFEVLETTFRVLHAPTFFRSYKEFWVASHESPTAFLVQLLLVCAAANAVLSNKSAAFVGPSSVQRDTATKWIEVCETWLDLQSQKHMTLEVFQVQVLITIAKKMNCVKLKRAWTMAGYLLRLAMAIGLHREPTFLNKRISPFDQEMRRRLWFTILELEIQASLDRGMCASLGPLDWDCLPPLNIHDEDFDQTTDKMPPPRPMTEFTRTSFLCLAQKHLPLRLEVLSRINSVRMCIDSDDALELDQRLRRYLDDVPQWPDSLAKIASQPMSQLLLHEFLLQTHQPIVAQDDLQARLFFSRLARHDAAFSTVRIYSELRPNTAVMLTNLRDDLFRALLALSHVMIISLESKDLMHDRNATLTLIQRGVDIMENRIRLLGQGFHSYWLASSALGLLQSKLLERPPEALAQETADRVAGLHRYMMELQVNPVDGLGDSVEEAAMSTANTLVGMSGQLPNVAMPELEQFAPMGAQFNAFSDTLFDFDMTDIWGLGNYQQFE